MKEFNQMTKPQALAALKSEASTMHKKLYSKRSNPLDFWNELRMLERVMKIEERGYNSPQASAGEDVVLTTYRDTMDGYKKKFNL